MKNFNFKSSVLRKMRDAVAAAALIAATLPAQAQTVIINYDNVDLSLIPKVFSYSGKPQFAYYTSEKADVYDENLLLIKHINYQQPKELRKEVTEERVQIGEEDNKSDCYYISEGIYVETPTESPVKIISEYYADSLKVRYGYDWKCTSENGIYTFVPVEVPEGRYYYVFSVDINAVNITTEQIYDPSASDPFTPKEAYIAKFEVEKTEYIRTKVYSDEWVETDAEVYYDNVYNEGVEFYDYDADYPMYTNRYLFTQTLFNKDEKYEFFCEDYELKNEPYICNTEWTYNAKGEEIPIKRILSYSSRSAGTKVVSETGEVICSFPYPLENIKIWKYGGKYYVVAYEYDADEDVGKKYFYEIGNGSVNQVKAFNTSALNIFPRSVRRSETVTVETGEETVNEKKELVVSASDGSIIDRRSIPAGEKAIQMNTSRLSAGVYNFTVFANGKRVDNGKIIVR